MNTRPRRLTDEQPSQIFLTEARTFMPRVAPKPEITAVFDCSWIAFWGRANKIAGRGRIKVDSCRGATDLASEAKSDMTQSESQVGESQVGEREREGFKSMRSTVVEEIPRDRSVTN